MKNKSLIELPFFVLVIFMLYCAGIQANDSNNEIKLLSGQFTPEIQVSQEIVGKLSENLNRHVLIQFDHIPSTAEKQSLAANGIHLLSYLPHNAWYAYLDAIPNLLPDGIRYIDKIKPALKITPQIQQHGFAERSLLDDTRVAFTVVFHRDVNKEQVEALLSKYGAGEMLLADTWEIVIDQADFDAFVDEDLVQWIENAEREKTTHLNYVRYKINADEVQAAPYNLHGTGYTAAMWDAGVAYAHGDYSSRLTSGDGSSTHYHATLVCGIMAGDGSRGNECGTIEGYYRGIANDVNVVSYNWNSHTGEHDSAINTYGADVSQHAWGYNNCQAGYCDGFGEYDTYSRLYDIIIRGYYTYPITVIGSAGNDGECTTCSGELPDYPYGTVSGPVATSKNALSVSATHANNDGWWSSSSRGPTQDGRIKPDIAAPGCKSFAGVKTTYTDNCYDDNYCGTSFSSPATSGSAILMYEEYNNLNGTDPLPSTIRAIFYHTSEDLGHYGPDYLYGYGRINVQDAVDLIIADAGYGLKIVQDDISTSALDEYYVEVGAGEPRIKVTIAWDDKEASTGASIKLVNNIDLELVSPSAVTYYPFILDPDNPGNTATTGIDNLNNMEQVIVSLPEEGLWTIRVNGTAIPYGPQNYSLIADFVGIDCVYKPGDVNGDDAVIGSDVTFLVNYFRGGLVPVDSCYLDAESRWLYVAGDVNGDCALIGADVTYLVNYFRGLTPGLLFCPALPPPGDLLNSSMIESKPPLPE